jgi:hypothetical protein
MGLAGREKEEGSARRSKNGGERCSISGKRSGRDSPYKRKRSGRDSPYKRKRLITYSPHKLHEHKNT